jgi:DNA-binding Lrp family transcriptional regulator
MLYIRPNQQKTKEYQFLNDFLEINFFSKYLNNHELDCTILQEPFTGLGYTDLVAIVWNKEIYNKWQKDRNKLKIIDIKILHYLYLNNKYKTILEITTELGFSKREITNSISRLDKAGLLKFTKDNKFKSLKKSDIFYIKEIISIEAKLKDWRRALYQAFTNMYYSSESYILFPEESITHYMLDIYKETDIGIISFKEDIDVIKKAKKMTIPANFNSWLFNEYIGRSLEWQ